MKSLKLSLLLLVYLWNVSCNKSEIIYPTLTRSDNAIIELKKIVGNNGNVFKIDTNNSNKVKIDHLMTLNEFKIIYNHRDTLIRIKNDKIHSKRNDIKSNSTILNDESPGRPGLHKIKFYATPISYFKGIYGINNSISSFSVLNFWYETDISGRVIGTPIMFYTGVNILQTWTQLVVSKIEFNPVTSINTFSIGGKTTYGLNIYNQLIGYEHGGGFNISINMINSMDGDGDIRIIGWK